MIEVFAPAKLTVSLRVVGVRGDGYHLIDAEMVSLDFGDTLEIDPRGDSLEVERDGVVQPGSPDDLVARALRRVDRHARVRLRKVVPAGAGLGGGSADAAAILRWADVTDPLVAVELGAASVDHDLGAQGRAVWIARAGDARRVAGVGPDADSGLCRALAVGVDQPHVAPCQGAGDGELNGQRRLADAALGVSYCNNHIGTSEEY